jgi:phage terminase large subunit
MTMADIIGWCDADGFHKFIKPAKPTVLDHAHWPPDYKAIYEWRKLTLSALLKNPTALKGAKQYYKTRPVEFIMDWLDTYDPRRSDSKWIPFVFFTRQEDFILFLHDLRTSQQNGLVEKSRDMGATWLASAYSVWSFLFIDNDSIGWGSRKEALVDVIGDPDSIFEKMRLMMNRMPAIWLPKNFQQKKYATFMKLVNPENGANITGEAGDNIGRGGRKAMYFKDEAAHYERPEKIESALGDNTNVQVDISSVNGLGNVFHRRREAGINWSRDHKIEPGYTRVFVMDWKDHPGKTIEWYETRKAKYEREGMAHVFAQEVDRNYSAAISNTVIPYEYIEAAVDAHLKIPYVAEYMAKNQPNNWVAGLDVADEGIDRNALAKRQWIIWRTCEEWGERDPGVTARRAIMAIRQIPGIKCMYDSIGIGASVKSEYNRLVEDENLKNIPPFIPWNAGGGVLEPFNRIIPDDDESMMNKDFYENMKAQAWWSLRARFYKTYKVIKEGAYYHPDELISLDSSMECLLQLMKELAQPTRGQSGRLKQMINKQPKGTKSPNLADAGMMMFFPVPDNAEFMVGSYG